MARLHILRLISVEMQGCRLPTCLEALRNGLCPFDYNWTCLVNPRYFDVFFVPKWNAR
jgi:hypothetical protein